MRICCDGIQIICRRGAARARVGREGEILRHLEPKTMIVTGWIEAKSLLLAEALAKGNTALQELNLYSACDVCRLPSGTLCMAACSRPT